VTLSDGPLTLADKMEDIVVDSSGKISFLGNLKVTDYNIEGCDTNQVIILKYKKTKKQLLKIPIPMKVIDCHIPSAIQVKIYIDLLCIRQS
jgi:hypothetical protein